MKFQFKTLFGVASILFSMAGTQAASAEKGVVVIAKDGTETNMVFTSLDRMELGTSELALHHSDGTTKSVAYADVDRVLIGTDISESAVKNLLNPGEIAIWPTTVTSDVNATGLEPGSIMTVYTLSGATAAQAAAGESGTASVDLSAAESGIYIVTAGDKTAKIVKK